MSAFNARDMDGFLKLLGSTDTKAKLTIANNLINFLADPDNSFECADIGQFIDSLIPWMNSSNNKAICIYIVLNYANELGMRRIVYLHLHGGRVENFYTLSGPTPDGDLNLDHPIIGYLVYHEIYALDIVDTALDIVDTKAAAQYISDGLANGYMSVDLVTLVCYQLPTLLRWTDFSSLDLYSPARVNASLQGRDVTTKISTTHGQLSEMLRDEAVT
uniref:Uncharacterized protein n=1 Tax=Timema bartmani TaxID=61472 RepID=A0A7R9HYA1_9NEOP|nr:unnamed protein product [Timema bartmani]